ncbi:DUF3828 domain-containing protein [Spirosoma soli]|uniref:DUF3828 domain-containing protein n=1 Tax=Spirosoma soli TaxID=1770529 RepID=A0ABW5M5E5_9BACT
MKTSLLAFLALVALLACHSEPQTNHEATTPGSSTPDSAAVADAVHGFYQWYVTFLQDPTKQIDFTDDSGEHLQLIRPKLERYLAHVKASGFVSDAFIAGEAAFYQQCSQVWQNEPIDEVPSCLDGDRYFCAQDWDATFWTRSPVRIKTIGPNKIRATLYGSYYNNVMERSIELVRENGKWLISHIDCD